MRTEPGDGGKERNSPGAAVSLPWTRGAGKVGRIWLFQ